MHSWVRRVVVAAFLGVLVAPDARAQSLPLESSNCDGDAGCWSILAVPQYAQQDTLWCHAAVAQSVVNAYSTDRTQCTTYQQNTGLACTTNEISYVSNVESTIRVLSSADGTIYNGYLSWSASWDYLYNRHNPIVARVLKDVGNGAYGHFVVIKGADGDSSTNWIRVWDPENGGSAAWIDYSTFISAGGRFQWTHSIYNFQ
jgi:hypothetical protein